MQFPRPHRHAAAFSLTEVSVVAAIVLVLAALVTPAIQSVRAKADQAACASNLRQIGSAMASYVAENDGRLPGPLYTKQGAYYGTSDPYALPMVLASYLQLPTNVRLEKAALFVCPAWRKAVKDDRGKVYSVQTAAPLPDNTTVQPFGYPPAPPYAEKTPIRIYSLASASKTAAMWDYDVLNGGPSDNSVPKTPAHKTSRNTLFFDWHVEAVPANP